MTIKNYNTLGRAFAGGASVLCFMALPAVADTVLNDDHIVVGSSCIGIDCVNGEAFGFDTLRLKENNLRVKFIDTSTSASFPTNDWEITINDSTNGGNEKFSVLDVTNNKRPFAIEGNSPTKSLYVDQTGGIGFGTNNPVVELHVVDGNTPTLRLEQDGSAGFGLQTWDIASNEANFFVRDYTNGSQLPFRIQPGADSDTLFLASDNEVGIGTATPDAGLHVVKPNFLIEAADSGVVPTEMVEVRGGNILVKNAAAANITLDTTTNPDTAFRIQLSNTTRFSYVGSGIVEMELDRAGNLTVAGDFISGGTTLAVPDYVFAADYDLMPLSQVARFIKENSHLPKIQSASDIAQNGINYSQMQMGLLEKVEELTLYTLAQQEELAGLQDLNLTQAEQISALMTRLDQLTQ